MNKINLFKKTNIILNEKNKEVSWEGKIGFIKKSFNGVNIYFNRNKIFLFTKNSYRTFITILKNNIKGVFFGYFIEINFIGLGSRFLRLKDGILLKLGYSHYIKYKLSKSIVVIGYKRTFILYGLDLQEVNALAKKIRFFKKPNIYKGKGIQIQGEVINFKIGKQK